MLLTLVACVGVAACGADDEQPATTATAPPRSIASTTPVEAAKPPRGDDVALLTDVRAARHAGYDRVVFEFRDTLPGYDVRYVERPIRQDGSGAIIDVQGDALLQVRLRYARDADLDEPSAPRTYTGPTRLQPGTSQVVELVRAGGFEAVLTWVVGLGDRVPFRVSTLTEPPRLVIDVRHDGCGRAAGLDVEVVDGDVPCDAARKAVAGYDPDAGKVQQVGGFTCEGGAAATRPVVLTCVSDSGEVIARTSR